MNTARLVIVTARDIHLKDALAAFPSRAAEPAVALLYDPNSCRFARLGNDGLLTRENGAEEGPTELSRVFEARVFNDTMELRWLKTPAGTGTGRAAILAELDANTELSPQPGTWSPLDLEYPTVIATHICHSPSTSAPPQTTTLSHPPSSASPPTWVRRARAAT